MLLQAIISQSTTTTEDNFIIEYYFGATNLYDSGRYGRIVAPKCTFHDGYTYLTGREDVTNRDPILFRYKDGVVNSIDVGTIDNSDPLDHQHPAILIIANYIYIFMVDGHGKNMKIWKSNTTDMMDGFTLHREIIGNFGYCCPRLLSDGRVIIYQRYTTSGPVTLYSQGYLLSDVDDYTTWTEVQVTDADFSATDIRHYPSAIKHYGTNTYNYFGISFRYEPNEYYIGQAIHKTLDFETYSNLDETFSQDVTVTPLDNTDLQDNFMIVGDLSANTTYVSVMSCIVINDVVYGSAVVSGVWKYYKIIAGVTTFYDCDLPNLQTTSTAAYQIDMYWNGSNIVIFSKGKVYKSDLNFSNVEFQEQYYELAETSGVNLVQPPENFNEINADYMLAGSNLEIGVFPYIITNKKFQ